MGNVESLFFICAFAAIVMLPFVFGDFHKLNGHTVWPLVIVILVTFIAAGVNFQAFKIGKISVVETVLGIELPLTLLFSMIFKGERITIYQALLVLAVFWGVLLSVQEDFGLHIHFKERGTILALIGSINLALINVFMGIASIETSPLFANWSTSLVIALCLLAYMFYRKEKHYSLIEHLRKYPGLLLRLSLVDNGAWVAYSYGTLYIPVAIASTVSEGYIALAAALGIIVNKEKLKSHQMAGVFLAIGAIIILSAISGNAAQ